MPSTAPPLFRLPTSRAAGYAAMSVTVLVWSGFALTSRSLHSTSLTTGDAALTRFVLPAIALLPVTVRGFSRMRRVAPVDALMIVAGGGLPFFLLVVLGGSLTSAAYVGALTGGGGQPGRVRQRSLRRNGDLRGGAMARDSMTEHLAVRRTADGAFIEELVRPALAISMGLEPHPEGGWYRRTWTSPSTVHIRDDEGNVAVRPSATLIHFFLPIGEASAWHRVTSSEIWIWNGCGRVELQTGGSGEQPVPGPVTTLGSDESPDESSQVVIPGDVWQRTLPGSEDALVTCLVSPGFDFADFTMA